MQVLQGKGHFHTQLLCASDSLQLSQRLLLCRWLVGAQGCSFGARSLFLGKFCKLVRCKLSPIVTNDNVRDSVSGKVALEFPDASTGFGVMKSVHFPKVGTVVDQNKVVFSSKN